MSRDLFLRIKAAVEVSNPYFVQRPDATGKLGLTCLQKCTAAIRQLAYGSPSDAMDKYVRMGDSTARKSLIEFCSTVVKLHGREYLRAPNRSDLQRLLRVAEERGFPGMLESLDCCHWQWKNCPTAWAGQYKGKKKKPSIVLEAVASYDLWIWHAFFGLPGSNNNITVLHRSPPFSDLYAGSFPLFTLKLTTTHTRRVTTLQMASILLFPRWYKQSMLQSVKSRRYVVCIHPYSESRSNPLQSQK